MSHLGIPTINYIMQKSGRKPTSCSCEKCKSQCHTPCLGTPEDIERLIDAGYKDRLAPTEWIVGMMFGIINCPVLMVQAKIENGWCTFYHDGRCELHDNIPSGLTISTPRKAYHGSLPKSGYHYKKD